MIIDSFNVVDTLDMYQRMKTFNQVWSTSAGMDLYADAGLSGGTYHARATNQVGDEYRFYKGPTANHVLNTSPMTLNADPIATWFAFDNLIYAPLTQIPSPAYASQGSAPFTDARLRVSILAFSPYATGDNSGLSVVVFGQDSPKKIDKILFVAWQPAPGGLGTICSVVDTPYVLAEIMLGGMSLSASAANQIAQELSELLQVVVNVTNEVQPGAPVDLAPVVTAIESLAQDDTLDRIANHLEMDEPADYSTQLDDIAAGVEALEIAVDHKENINETNRQLSLIDSRLYWIDQYGVKHPFLAALQTGAGFDGKLRTAGGDVIDLADLLEQVISASAAGSILVGEKLEDMRGFFALLKSKWTTP